MLDGFVMDDGKGLTPTILRLRALREQLCSSQSDWKRAFEVRDFVISELKMLHEMLEDETVERSDCSAKAKGILDQFVEDDHGKS